MSRSATIESAPGLCLRDSPELHALLVDPLVARRRQANEEAAAASFLSLRACFARALLQFAEHLGEPTGTPDQLIIRHKLRPEDLAALADVARESKVERISQPPPAVPASSRIDRSSVGLCETADAERLLRVSPHQMQQGWASGLPPKRRGPRPKAGV